MTCRQFDSLHAQAGGSCQICRTPEHEAPAGVLQIDHDKKLGYWAVRGLLCVTCNSAISGRIGMTGPEVDRYMAAPWYAGLEYAHLIQPEDDAVVPLAPDVVRPLLVRAGAEADRARREKDPDHRRLSQIVRDLMRAADLGGMRQVDIARASGRTREAVYTATRERRAQPKIPRQREQGKAGTP